MVIYTISSTKIIALVPFLTIQITEELDESGSWDFTFTIHDWEEYDDFSDGTLASEKWETGYWDGAQAPDIVDGKARLSSNGYGSGSQQPSFIDDLYGMPDNGTNHSFLSILSMKTSMYMMNIRMKISFRFLVIIYSLLE